MSELALYRKYRSQNFNELIGQKHIVATLTNAIAAGRVSHAYLFTGPRGVGKTSAARLLAKSVNCVGEIKPCNACSLCIIPLGSNMDIIEIDAASNRRIDEMRDLREKVNLAPSRSRYKVYIVDEVHMLTTEAFNALLKTLEEPPAHVIFILATTEAHKVPETIISRTQRFNFNPIKNTDIVSHLGKIAEKEKIKIDSEALEIIATVSRGGFRDAISMLDQLATIQEGTITPETLREVLGWADNETIDKLSLAIATQNPSVVLATIETMYEQGSQAGQLCHQLIKRWRHFLAYAVGLNQGTEPDATTKEVARLMQPGEIIAVIESLASVTASQVPQIALEATAVRLSMSRNAQRGNASAPQTASTKAVPKPAEPKSIQQPAVTSDESFEELWPKVMLQIKMQNNSLYSVLSMCQIQFTGEKVEILCRFNFHQQRLQESKNHKIIQAATDKVYGKKLRVICTLDLAPTPAEVSKLDPAAELVSSALEILGGEIVDE